MKKEFIVERQGRSFVLYAGLLDEAHAQGLKSIRTSLLQVPSADNGNVAICQAIVETEKGVFTGIGDASPANVASGMANCIIRMAETRAKARALRDAVNVGVAALEELSDGDDALASEPAAHSGAVQIAAGHSSPREAITNRAKPGVYSSNGPSTHEDMATPAQVRTIYIIAREQHGLSSAQVDEKCLAQYGQTPSGLTKRQASELITTLKTS